MQFKQGLRKLLKWLHYNRLVIVIFMFVVVLPIALVLTIYLGSYFGNKNVYFDEEKTSETVMIRQFIDVDDIEHFNLIIDWESLRKPVLNESDALTGGYYTFKARYEVQEGYQVSNLLATPVLQTPWTPVRYLGQPVQLTNQDRIIFVNFNHQLPIRPLWFVTVTDPILYLKITYQRTLANQSQVEDVVYVRIHLKDQNPNIVVTT